MRTFVITNSGGRVTDDDAQRIIQASLKELVNFCAAWGLVMPEVTYCADGSSAQPTDDVIDLADQPPQDENGVLGEHTEVGDQARGSVYVGYELDNGGKVLALDGSEPAGATTGAAIFFHELTEQIRDALVNEWWDGPLTVGGTQWASVAAEVSDPVEDGFIKQTADDGTEVWLSNYVLPSWHDSESTAQSGFDANGALTTPFTITAGGYVVVRNAPGTETPVFGDKMPAHRRKLKEWLWKGRMAA